MARLAPGKGLEYLLEAAAALPPELSGARIAIAGDGPARTAIERLAQERGVGERVILLGFREDVGDLLAACDIVALPSLREGLSIALLEAMSAGKPIIATSIGSHVEVASQAEIALLVPTADSGALAAAIARLANDPALRASARTQRARAVREALHGRPDARWLSAVVRQPAGSGFPCRGSCGRIFASGLGSPSTGRAKPVTHMFPLNNPPPPANTRSIAVRPATARIFPGS